MRSQIIEPQFSFCASSPNTFLNPQSVQLYPESAPVASVHSGARRTAAGLLPRTVPGHVSHIQIELLQSVLMSLQLSAIASTKYERSLVAKGVAHLSLIFTCSESPVLYQVATEINSRIFGCLAKCYPPSHTLLSIKNHGNTFLVV